MSSRTFFFFRELDLKAFGILKCELVSRAVLDSEMNTEVCTGIFFQPFERFSYDLEMKTREHNKNNKRTEIERFDWFI